MFSYMTMAAMFGALMNLVWFGLADICVGRFRQAFWKGIVHCLALVALSFMLGNASGSWARVVVEIVGLVYFAYIVVAGYRTVMDSA